MRQTKECLFLCDPFSKLFFANRDSDRELKWSLGKLISTAKKKPAPRQLPPFFYPTGPSPRTEDAVSPLQILEYFLTVVILESIVQQTILFASQKGVTFVFCIEELQAFIGVNIAMGMLRLPQIRDYWATNNILATPWFPSIMSQDRFLSILRFLHLADSTKQKKQGEQGYDPLFKVRALIDHLSAVFQQYYQSLRQLSIDEMMVGTRCRIAFLQFMHEETHSTWDKDLGKL